MKTLLILLVSIPAMAAPPKPPKSLDGLTAMARHYIQVERRVGTVPTAELIAHWQELHALRVGLSRLDRRGELKQLREGRRVVLRHVLAQLLGEQTDVAVDADPRVERAHSQRTEDLFTISELARRAFDIATADANGTWSPS